MYEIINEELEKYSKTKPISDINVNSLSPLAFEGYCADLLSNAGWNASITKGSGDQGIDIIAVKNGIKIVLQCKKYSSPVGNKAVQEAGR